MKNPTVRRPALLTLALAACLTGSLFAQMPMVPSSDDEVHIAEEEVAPDVGGWKGVFEPEYFGIFILLLMLATALGALIGWQPKYGGRVNEEVEAPKICILYSVVGAVIGAMVDKHGMVIGFVIFGIGGLFRFRTNLGSARKTGRVILATLTGLSCGLGLPHMGVATALFSLILLYMLDRTATYRILIKSLPHEHIPDAAAAYRSILEDSGCYILSEKKNFLKSQVSIVFRVRQSVEPEDLQERFDIEVPEGLRGAVDFAVQ